MEHCSQLSVQMKHITFLYRNKYLITFLKKCKGTSYRPVSLTSHIVKTYERVVKKYLQNFLEFNMKINQAQHGFREKRSCLSQLLEHYEDILKGLEEGVNVETIYLDFAKAFDKVDIGILSRRMKEKGIHGMLGVWLHNFLTDRKQHVIANNGISDVSFVKSGVPQGTVLGPLLFIILIDSLSEVDLMSEIRMFADDTRVTKYIRTEEDMKNLQTDLEKIYQWQESNNMQFNGAKY